MLNVVRYVKGRLSHVRTNSWHYQMVKTIWDYRAEEGKACTYYWVKIPTSFIVFCAGVVIAAFLSIIGLFFGRVMTFFKASDPQLKWVESSEIYYPYKTLPTGKKIPVAPWEIAVPLGLLAGIYHLIFVDTTLGMIVVGILSGLALLVLVAFLLYKAERVRTAVWRTLVTAYNKVCPPLVVVE